VGTLKTPAARVDIPNPNAVKVVTDTGAGLSISLAPSFRTTAMARARLTTNTCFYAYASLRWIDSWRSESSLERCERLEQLRFLENGIPIHVGETPHDTVGVDTERIYTEWKRF